LRRLPKFIRLLGHKVLVSVVPDLTHDNGDEDDEHRHFRAYGVYDPAGPLIWLDQANRSERMKSTLVHEALHAMLNIAHIDEVQNEEELVSRLGPLVLDFIRANRGTIAYLQES